MPDNTAATTVLPRFAVELRAENIEVTAGNSVEALDFAKDDANEFANRWHYRVVNATRVHSTEPLTENIGDPRPSLAARSVAADTHTFDATYMVVVEAPNRFAAGEQGLRLAIQPDQIDEALTAYRADFLALKIAPALHAALEPVQRILAEHGFDVELDASPFPKLFISDSENSVMLEHTFLTHSERAPNGEESSCVSAGLVLADEHGEVLGVMRPVSPAAIALDDDPTDPTIFDWIAPVEMLQTIQQQFSELTEDDHASESDSQSF